MKTIIVSSLVASCSGYALGVQQRHARSAAARVSGVHATMPAPPAGYEWGAQTGIPDVSSDTAPAKAGVSSWYDSGLRLEGVPAASAAPAEAAASAEAAAPAEAEFQRQAYYCNEQGCWVGSPEELPPVVLPDGRPLDKGGRVEPSSTAAKPVAKPKKVVAQGIFAPAVLGAKAVMGTKELNALRAQVIAQHTKVISAFVDTSDSPFGQLVLSRMFEAADKDNNGTLDKEEIRDALHALGFTFVEDKLLDKIMTRADENGDQVIDFEEFVKETPKTLRTSLVKLAKKNGHDLGFLA